MENQVGKLDEATLDVEEINFKELLYVIIRKWWLILIFMIIFGIMGYSYSSTSYQPLFTADASMVVNSKQTKILGGEVTLTNDIYLSQKMVNTYQVILLSDSVLDLVNKELDSNFDLEQMRSWIQVSSPKDTEVIIVEVTNSKPEISVGIANAIMKVAPEIISKTVEVGSINVVDYAKLPDTPQAPTHHRNTALGITFGNMLSLLLILARYFLTPKFKNSKEISEKLSLRILAEIPNGKFRKDEYPLINNKNADIRFKEAFRSLTFRLIHLSKDRKMKKVLITSAGEKEGKTLVSINTAISLANEGYKVLLLECDLHKPNILKKLKYSYDSKRSLRSILEDNANFKESVITDEKNGIDILYAGHNVDDTAKLLGSDKMKNFLENIEKNYDFIILDTAPSYILNDAVTLSRFVDEVVIVVRQEQSPVEIIKNTKLSFENLGINILGVIFNDIRYTGGNSNYKYKYKYDYSYNKKSKKKEVSTSRKIIALTLLSLWMIMITTFALQNGNHIVELSEKFVTNVIQSSDNLGLLENHSESVLNKSGTILLYKEKIEYWTLMMEHFIHSILFFSGTLLSLFALGSIDMKRKYSVIITLLLMLIIAFGNEIIQSVMVSGRGFEYIDITFSFLGIILAFITWNLKNYLLREK